MPRQPRLDALPHCVRNLRPDTLHHVMVWEIERRAIFKDDTDREDLVARLAALAEAEALTVNAWALLPSHAHLLVRYLHLNPLRAKVLPDLRSLDRYLWSGHGALVGTVPRPCNEGTNEGTPRTF